MLSIQYVCIHCIICHLVFVYNNQNDHKLKPSILHCLELFWKSKRQRTVSYAISSLAGTRDYIHIEDLAEGHLKALSKLEKSSGLGFKAYNLGSGQGHTVLEVIRTFQEVCNVPHLLCLENLVLGIIITYIQNLVWQISKISISLCYFEH